MDRWRPVLLACLVLTVMLGGCTDGADDRRERADPNVGGAEGDDAHTDGSGSRAARPGLATGLAPLWFPGLYWTYEVTSPQLTTNATLGLLVHGAEGSDSWRLHTDADAELVAVLAQQGFPYLMAVDGETWTYRTHRGTHDLWAFPIEDNETWRVNDHHDRVFDATAVRTTTTTPGGRTVDAYDIRFEQDEVAWLQVTYTPAVAGFTRAMIDANLDGHVDVTLVLSDVGSTGRRSAYQPIDVALAASSSVTGPTTDAASPTTFGSAAGFATHIGAWAWMRGTTSVHRTSVSFASEDLFVFEWRNTNTTLTHHVETAVAPYGPDGGGSLTHAIVGDGTTSAEVVQITIGAET